MFLKEEEKGVFPKEIAHMSISSMNAYTCCFFCRRLGHCDSFFATKMELGYEIKEIGWDLSLRAPTRRALSPGSVWLREGGQGGCSPREGGFDRGTTTGYDVGIRGGFINPMLGINL